MARRVLPVGVLQDGLAPPAGTYTYPEGAAAGNGADIFRAGIGLTKTDSWWRVDWNTLVNPSIPIALFALETGRASTGAGEWPAGAGVRSAGTDRAVLVSGNGAWLIDLETGSWTAVGQRRRRGALFPGTRAAGDRRADRHVDCAPGRGARD